MDPRSAAEPMHDPLCTSTIGSRGRGSRPRDCHRLAVAAPAAVAWHLEALEPEQQAVPAGGRGGRFMRPRIGTGLGQKRSRCSLRLCGPRLALNDSALAGSLAEDALSAAERR